MSRKRRGHFRSDGTMKHRHSEEVAIMIAAKMTEQYGSLRNAYACDYCDAWHVGRSPNLFKKRDKDVLFVELGDRGWWNSCAENGGPLEKRLKHIYRLVEAAEIHESRYRLNG